MYFHIYVSVYQKAYAKPQYLYICVPEKTWTSIYLCTDIWGSCWMSIRYPHFISTAYGIIQTREGFPRSDIIINRLWPACAQSGKQIRLQRWQKKVNSYQYRKKLTPSFHKSFIINNGCLPLLMPICIRIHINLYICVPRYLYICAQILGRDCPTSIYLCTENYDHNSNIYISVYELIYGFVYQSIYLLLNISSLHHSSQSYFNCS